MPERDVGHEQTEKILQALERRIAQVYAEARDGVKQTIEKYWAGLAERDRYMRALVQKGEITQDYYTQWLQNQIGRGERYEALQSQLAERVTNAAETAYAYINDATPQVYSLNRNYGAYTIERVAGNVGFTIWDESTVRRLLVQQPELMPYYPPKKALKYGIDLEWGKKQIRAAIQSGILRGESIGEIANDLRRRIPDMSRKSALRTARTAVTSAQNGGRMDSYKAASDMGIKVRKRWVATKDSRTRDAHQKLDGKTADWDEPFISKLGEIRYPGDPRAKPALTYNCRCTLRTVEKPGIEAEPRKMRVQTPEYTKALEAEEKEKNRLNYLRKRILEETDAQKLIGLEKREKELQKSVNALEKKRKATQKNVVVNEMTYDEWERWVKSRA